MSAPLIIVGAGGHAKVLVAALQAQGARILGLIDRADSTHGSTVLGLKVLGGEEIVFGYAAGAIELVNGVGSVRTVDVRRQVFERLKQRGYRFANVVHPSVVAAADAQLGEGAELMAGVVLQPGVVLGANTLVNTGAVIDHDCTIGAHTHVAPGAVLSGGVRVGDEAHIGTGAVVIQGIEIGAGAIVAAGAVVTRNVAAGARVGGVPARELSE